MATFVGWSPTILGRVAFSRIGDHCPPGSVLANETKGLGQLFGVTKRTSRDGPFVAWVTDLMGRYPYTDWALFFEVQSGELPFEKDACDDADDDSPIVVLRKDDRAELAGRMYFLNGASNRLAPEANAAMARVRDDAYLAMGGRTPARAKSNAFHGSLKAIGSAVSNLSLANRKGQPTPIAGAVDVVLSRSGLVTIIVEPQNLLTTEEFKAAHRAGAPLDETSPSVQAELERIANQAFFALRDLTHQHYHHKARSDLLTTVTPWTAQTDEDWRRQTQYGLTRMAIAVRRRNQAASYRQALGIVAYADAFQRHFCGWTTDSSAPGGARNSKVSFKYDFAALRASIEASLKVRELKDANGRARLFFAFGTAVTALSILVPRYRDLNDDLPFWPDLFRDGLRMMVDNPLPSLLLALVTGWLIDKLFLNLSLNPDWFEKSQASVSRLAGGVMAMMRRRNWPAQAAQLSTFALMMLIVAASAVAVFHAYRLTFGLIGAATMGGAH